MVSPPFSGTVGPATKAETSISSSVATRHPQMSSTYPDTEKSAIRVRIKGPVRPPPPSALRVREQDEVRVLNIEAAQKSAGEAKKAASVVEEVSDGDVVDMPVGVMRLPRKKRWGVESMADVFDEARHGGMEPFCGEAEKQWFKDSAAVSAELEAVKEELRGARPPGAQTAGASVGSADGAFGMPKISFRGGVSAEAALDKQQQEQDLAVKLPASSAGGDPQHACSAGNMSQGTTPECDLGSSDSAGGAGNDGQGLDVCITTWPSLRFLQKAALAGRCFGLASSIAGTDSISGFLEIPVGVTLGWSKATTGDEFFVVELGKAWLDVSGRDQIEIQCGDHVVIPRGSCYCFENVGERPCRMAWFVPGGCKSRSKARSLGFFDGEGLDGRSGKGNVAGGAGVSDRHVGGEGKEHGDNKEQKDGGNLAKDGECGGCKADKGDGPSREDGEYGEGGEGVQDEDGDTGEGKTVEKTNVTPEASEGTPREPPSTPVTTPTAALAQISAKPPAGVVCATPMLPVRCDICGWTFRKRGNLNNHRRTVHGDGQRDYMCDQCGMSFVERHNRDSHVKLVCGGAKPFSCDTCGSKFGRKSSLRQHVKTVHEKQRPWVCSVCGQAFGQKSTLAKHVKAVCAVSSSQASSAADLGHGKLPTTGIDRVLSSSVGSASLTAVDPKVDAARDLDSSPHAASGASVPSTPLDHSISVPVQASRPASMHASCTSALVEPKPVSLPKAEARSVDIAPTSVALQPESQEQVPNDRATGVPAGKRSNTFASSETVDDHADGSLKRRKVP